MELLINIGLLCVDVICKCMKNRIELEEIRQCAVVWRDKGVSLRPQRYITKHGLT